MAQCCIRHWQTTLATEQTKAHNERVQLLAATAPNKRVVHLPTPDVLNPPSTKVEAGDEMSMVFAEKCLRNAHYLLLRRYRGRKNRKTGDDDKAENDTEDDNDEGDGVLEESELHNASAEDPEMAAVLQSVYVNMTYVALCLSNPSVALASAEKLYLLPTLYRENRIVVLSYMAEALCKLGRQEEALAMLQGVNLENLLGGVCPRCEAHERTLPSLSQNADSSLTLPCGGIQADAHVTKSADLPKIGSSPVHFGMSSAESNEVRCAPPPPPPSNTALFYPPTSATPTRAHCSRTCAPCTSWLASTRGHSSVSTSLRARTTRLRICCSCTCTWRPARRYARQGSDAQACTYVIHTGSGAVQPSQVPFAAFHGVGVTQLCLQPGACRARNGNERRL